MKTSFPSRQFCSLGWQAGRILACTVALTSLLGCGPDDPAKLAAARKAAQPSFDLLKTMQQRARGGGSTCPVQEIKARGDDGRLRIELFNQERLRRLIDGSGKGKGYWDFLQSSGAALLDPLPKMDRVYAIQAAARRIEGMRQDGFVAVLTAVTRARPRMVARKSFRGGFVRGRVVVFDLKKLRPACSFLVRAQSSKRVFFRRNDFERKMRKDLRRNLREALNVALKKATADSAYLHLRTIF